MLLNKHIHIQIRCDFKRPHPICANGIYWESNNPSFVFFFSFSHNDAAHWNERVFLQFMLDKIQRIKYDIIYSLSYCSIYQTMQFFSIDHIRLNKNQFDISVEFNSKMFVGSKRCSSKEGQLIWSFILFDLTLVSFSHLFAAFLYSSFLRFTCVWSARFILVFFKSQLNQNGFVIANDSDRELKGIVKCIHMIPFLGMYAFIAYLSFRYMHCTYTHTFYRGRSLPLL